MTKLEQAHERYNSDGEFRMLVDLAAHMYLEQRATPSDLRSAAMLAAWKVDSITIRQTMRQPTKSL